MHTISPIVIIGFAIGYFFWIGFLFNKLLKTVNDKVEQRTIMISLFITIVFGILIAVAGLSSYGRLPNPAGG